MKNILFASTAFAALAIGGAASADIALFGDARLGLGYNINNDGSANGDEDVRAVSRVRFGVTMTGESDAGISFGATIRADNASGGQGGTGGQTAGEVFVSGAFGTLTFGDTNGADEQHVGDAIGGVGITGLGDFNETLFISNGGGFGDDDTADFANNPNARPTIRYDYSFGGLGVSVSSNRDLNDIGVGASYTAEFGDASVTGGVGYYDFGDFSVTQTGVRTITLDDGTTFEVEGDETTVEVQGGEQYSASITGTFSMFNFGVVYANASSQSSDFEELVLGAGVDIDAWNVSGFYADILDATGNASGFDGDSSYGLGVAYDLGGGASLKGGIAETFGDDTVGDFGITMAF